MSREYFGNMDLRIFREPSVDNLDYSELADYLVEYCPIENLVLEDSIEGEVEDSVSNWAKRFAEVRVKDVNSRELNSNPLLGEVRFEERVLNNPGKKVSGVLYDGVYLAKVYEDLMSENNFDINIVITNRLFGTFDQGRYHARVSLYYFPTLISTSGIVEAPARPKEFYEEKRGKMMAGQTSGITEELKEKYEGQYIDYDDERLTEVMKGYLLQAVFYRLFYDPFCQKSGCRLYNSHWQAEVLESQLEEPEFCEKHRKMIKNGKVEL